MAEAFQTTSEPKTTVDNYSYQETIEDLDKMNRELKEMKESMLKTNGIHLMPLNVFFH